MERYDSYGNANKNLGPVAPWYNKPGGTAGIAGAQPLAPQPAATQPAVTGPYVAPTPESTATPGLAAADWQNMMNLNRRANQGGWAAGAESLKRDLGGGGFRVGESGIADTALGNFYAQGAEKMGQNATQMAVEEAKNKFMQNMNMDTMAFAKSKWGQEFGASREDQAYQDMLNYMNIMQQNQQAPYAAYWGGMNQAINA